MVLMETMVKLAAIDDAPESLELIEAALACEGLRIFTNTDPEEGLDTVEVYPNGLSTSLPLDVQLAMVRSIHGCTGRAR